MRSRWRGPRSTPRPARCATGCSQRGPSDRSRYAAPTTTTQSTSVAERRRRAWGTRRPSRPAARSAATARPSRGRGRPCTSGVAGLAVPGPGVRLRLVRVAGLLQASCAASRPRRLAAPPFSTSTLQLVGRLRRRRGLRGRRGRAGRARLHAWSWWSSAAASTGVVGEPALLVSTRCNRNTPTITARPISAAPFAAARARASRELAVAPRWPTHATILPARRPSRAHRDPGSARRPSMRSRRACSRRLRKRRTVSGS